MHKTTKPHYYVGKYNEGYEASKGWFVGNFLSEDKAKTDLVEIKYAEHKAGDIGMTLHRHNKKTEIGLVVDGKLLVTIEGIRHTLEKGDFYFLDFGVKSRIEYLEDSTVIVIHAPCVPEDREKLEN